MPYQLVLPIVTLLLMRPAFAADDLKVEPVHLTEHRERELVKRKDGFPSGMSDGLQIKLRFSGPTAKTAKKIGNVQIKSATDDAGNSLIAQDRFQWGKQMDEIQRFGQSDEEKEVGTFDYDLRLGLPSRMAKAIKEVKGELTLLFGGEEKAVTVPAIKSMAGKRLDEPTLDAAGLSITVGKLNPKDPNSFPVEITGDMNTIRELRIVSQKGDNLVTGSWYTDDRGKRSASYMLTAPLDDKAGLELNLVVGQKTVQVPIDLQNLPLP